MDEASLYRLLSWCSPAYPTGGFSYSHGLEQAVETGSVREPDTLLDYVLAVLSRGGGWIDAVLFAHVWQAAADPVVLDELAELAAALRGSSEALLESSQQGQAFLDITRRAWPHPVLETFAARQTGRPVAHSVAVALACAAHGVPLVPAHGAFLMGFAANLVSAGARLIPLGQTAAQITVARLAAALATIGELARRTAIEDLGTAAPTLELCSMLHETQYTRLFRS